MRRFVWWINSRVMAGAYTNESPTPRAESVTIRRTSLLRIADTAFAIERVMSIGELKGRAHGRSDSRLLFKVLITASLPQIAASTSPALSGVPRTIESCVE